MMRIIVADDSGMARSVIRRCLEIAGCRDCVFLEAGNGQEVLQTLKAGGADLVVTDLNMPIMGGLELLKRIKASPRLHDTPVLIISSTVNQARREELQALGALDILSKPISPAVLAAAISPFLERRAGVC